MQILRYSYFIGVLVMGITLFLLIFSRKDLHKKVIITSFFFAIAGLFSAPIYNQDWWRPLTITHTYIGIEDFFFGFFLTGIAMSSYKVFFKKINIIKKKASIKKIVLRFGAILLLGYIPMLIGVYFFKLTSFVSSIVAGITISLFILTRRTDLIKCSILSGALTLILLLPAFHIPNILNPGWILSEWTYENLSKIFILGIPIEDVMWVFLVGVVMGPIFEFITGAKLKNKG